VTYAVTSDGFNYADGVEEVKRSGYRRDSRLEVVIEGAPLPDAEVLERELRGCLKTPASSEASDRPTGG